MNLTNELPVELQSVIGEEKIDFCVLAKRNHPKNLAISVILFGGFWTAFVGIFIVNVFGPLFTGKECQIEINGTLMTASLDNLQPMLFPALLLGIFAIVGIAVLSLGLYSFYQKGGYFVGTASRLLHFHKRKISSYDWEQFTGSMEINKKGNILLQLRYGSMTSRNGSSDKFIPSVVRMLGVPDVLEIEKICRKRIKENDPTLVNITKNE